MSRRAWLAGLSLAAFLGCGSAGLLLLIPTASEASTHIGIDGKRAGPGGQCEARAGRAQIPAGTVLLGEDGPDRPGERVFVPAFEIDRHEVTNAQFATFVERTGYRTVAEREGGSAVFVAPDRPVSLHDASQWWRYVKGAEWRHPTGPDSSIEGKDDWPVVQVTHADALAYAKWAGGELPSVAQWERAARGDQTAQRNPVSWAYDEHTARPLANSWQGVFPTVDTADDGHRGLAPVGCYPANSFGLQDMVGNVWEWTSQADSGRGLVKGGSYLCAMNYCANFRPAAYQAQELDLGTSHIGFRIVRRIAVPKNGG